jgi:preprotein translocase subunit SecG
MDLLITLLYILFVLSALVLIVVILLQEGKGGGLGDALGSAGQQTFGVKASGVQRFTMIVAILFIASAILIHVLYKRRSGSALGASVVPIEQVETVRSFEAPY